MPLIRKRGAWYTACRRRSTIPNHFTNFCERLVNYASEMKLDWGLFFDFVVCCFRKWSVSACPISHYKWGKFISTKYLLPLIKKKTTVADHAFNAEREGKRLDELMIVRWLTGLFLLVSWPQTQKQSYCQHLMDYLKKYENLNEMTSSWDNVKFLSIAYSTFFPLFHENLHIPSDQWILQNHWISGYGILRLIRILAIIIVSIDCRLLWIPN